MDFWDRMKEAVGKGISTSKDLLGKAGDKAQELGKKGVIRFEIMQLERQAEQLVTQLGSATFEKLEVEAAKSVSKNDEQLADIIAQIVKTRDAIAQKEFELKNTEGEK